MEIFAILTLAHPGYGEHTGTGVFTTAPGFSTAGIFESLRARMAGHFPGVPIETTTVRQFIVLPDDLTVAQAGPARAIRCYGEETR